MIIASATAASAAATVMIKIANTCPVRRVAEGVWLMKAEEYATSVMLTALSLISMLIRMETALRLLRAPNSPMQNSTAPSTRKFVSVMGLVLPTDHDGTDDGDEQHDGGNFEGQHVAIGERAVKQLTDARDRPRHRRAAHQVRIGVAANQRARTPGDGIDDDHAQPNGYQSSEPPLPAHWVAIGRHRIMGQHDGEENQDGDGARVDQHLDNRDEFGIEQHIDSSGGTERQHQEQRRAH